MADKKPLITLLDIETSPITAYTWGTYQQNTLKVLEPSKIISCAWKELGVPKINCKSIADYKAYKPGKLDDKKLIEEVWTVLDKSDVVIAHHGDAFDIKKLNARFVANGLDAPSFYKTIDTKKVASRYFRFDGNSLNALGGYLEIGKKVENGGFDLWVRCIAGDPKAWALMKEYNVGDVALLEQVYLKLRPFMENHPNLNVIGDIHDIHSCPVCLSHDLTKRGFSVTRTGRKQRFQCNDCGSWSSGPYQRSKITLR